MPICNKKKIKQYNKRISDLKSDFFMVSSTTQHVIDKELKLLNSKLNELEGDVYY